MPAYNILFKTKKEGAFNKVGTLYIGRVEGSNEENAAATAVVTLGGEYEVLGIVTAATSDKGHGSVIRSIVPVPVPKFTVNGSLNADSIGA